MHCYLGRQLAEGLQGKIRFSWGSSPPSGHPREPSSSHGPRHLGLGISLSAGTQGRGRGRVLSQQCAESTRHRDVTRPSKPGGTGDGTEKETRGQVRGPLPRAEGTWTGAQTRHWRAGDGPPDTRLTQRRAGVGRHVQATLLSLSEAPAPQEQLFHSKTPWSNH